MCDTSGLMQGSWKTHSVPGREHLFESGHQARHLPAQAVALVEGCSGDQGRSRIQGQGAICGFHEHVQNNCSWISHCSQTRMTGHSVVLAHGGIRAIFDVKGPAMGKLISMAVPCMSTHTAAAQSEALYGLMGECASESLTVRRCYSYLQSLSLMQIPSNACILSHALPVVMRHAGLCCRAAGLADQGAPETGSSGALSLTVSCPRSPPLYPAHQSWSDVPSSAWLLTIEV